MIVVSNSSPLITLARVGQLDLLRQLFGRIHIAGEVWEEVVVRGAGRPAADADGSSLVPHRGLPAICWQSSQPDFQTSSRSPAGAVKGLVLKPVRQ